MKPLPKAMYVICDSEEEVNELQYLYPQATIAGDPLVLHFAVGNVHYGRRTDLGENDWVALSAGEVYFLDENREESSKILFAHFKQYILPNLK